ncbi:MAG: hypothetical protein R3B57_09005 [Phycisphaerales bacterium]
MSARDQNARKIEQRDWEQIAGEWQNFVPEDPVSDPEHEIEELTSLPEIYTAVDSLQMGQRSYFEEIAGLRRAFYVDAIAQLRRAVHVLRVGLESSSTGYRSWSRATCYQAGFFGMRAVCDFLGCTVARNRHTNRYYQLDIWVQRDQGSSKAITDSEYRFSCYKRSPPQHMDWWSVLIRLVHCTRVSEGVWPYAAKDAFKQVDPERIPTQRNALHYKSSYWPFADLQAVDCNDSMAQLLASVRKGQGWADLANPDVGVHLGLQVVGMALALLRDLGLRVSSAADEHDLLLGRLDEVMGAGDAFMEEV